MNTTTKTSTVRRILLIAAFPAVLLIGVAMGASGDPVAPDPITNTETVTVEKIVERTPDACMAAMDAADEVNTYSGEGFALSSDAMNAAAAFDLESLDEANAGLNDLLVPLQVALGDYKAAAAECRAEGN